MALINCPECEKSISDQALSCPHCGVPTATAKEPAPEPSSDQATPATRGTVATKLKTLNKKFVILGSVAVLVAFSLFFSFRKMEEQKVIDAYRENLSSISSTILLGAAEAEDLGNLTKAVWYNTIYKERDKETDIYTTNMESYMLGDFNDDFNTSLVNLYSDPDIVSKIADIKTLQNSATEKYQQLQNPPAEFASAFAVLDQLYDDFMSFTNLVISPSGNLTTFSEKFASLDGDVVEGRNKLEALIAE